ncbi:uncharacterized protein LOC130450848 [Diorhabda sublineata]|uniref:uncharacterized protein LOC130450848 n=1 Tax=Diorhabda sublineata TaxID=1163346 RepID=UPI0024E16F32|nr:uncharacterized protein LOC130450848 [Diorhabda sublineata]
MSSIKSRDRILEAIDQLRRRKARPDIQRICNYLFRRFSVNSVEARNDLDWCVANNYVLKVEYKGSISYRNAAKKNAQQRHRSVDQKKPSVQSNIHDIAYKTNRQFNELLTNAFGELIVEEPDYLEMGIPGTEIINNILAKDSVRYTKKYISILLEKEVERGGLIKTENGDYLMGPSKDEESVKDKAKYWKRDSINVIRANEVSREHTQSNNRDDNHLFIQTKNKKFTEKESKKHCKNDHYENMDSSTNSADEKKSDGILRTGGRRKRAKKVFDPSDNHVPKKRGRPVGSLNRSTIEKQLARRINEDGRENRPESRTSSNGRDQHGVCSVCHIQNRRGPNDRMIACRECSNKAHYSCLNGDDMMLKMYPDNTWQCPHCKTCVVCFETSDAGNLTVCSVCADGYHASCHQPRIIEKIRNGQKWLCINCQMPDELKINQIQANVNSFSRKSNSDNNDISSSNSDDSSPSYNSSLSPTPPRLSPQTGGRDSPDADAQSDSQSNKEDDEDENIDTSIPDATHWSADEVYEYFAQYFPEEAKIFKEQEIDGRSLLLLKRIDVLTNLNLKLGPALKIYKHVVKLQVRRDDPKLYWF